jgi:putative heme-binding domain-containing protein
VVLPDRVDNRSLTVAAQNQRFRAARVSKRLTSVAMSAALVLAVRAPLAGQTEAGQQLYRAHCFSCHGQDGDSIPNVNLRGGQFRRAASDDDLSRLINAGIPGTGMPPTNLTQPQRQALVAYIRSMHNSPANAAPGDAKRGQAIFEGKGGCLDCHRVEGKGSRTGPDLSDVGTLRGAAYLERAILQPNESIAPHYRSVRAVTREGTVITGRRLNEDTHTIQLIDQSERLISLSKSDLRELTLLKTSSMPSYQGKLSSQEMADLISYLLALKGSQ